MYIGTSYMSRYKVPMYDKSYSVQSIVKAQGSRLIKTKTQDSRLKTQEHHLTLSSLEQNGRTTSVRRTYVSSCAAWAATSSGKLGSIKSNLAL